MQDHRLRGRERALGLARLGREVIVPNRVKGVAERTDSFMRDAISQDPFLGELGSIAAIIDGKEKAMNRLGLIVLAGAAVFVAGCGSRLASPSVNDFESCARATQMHVAAWKEFHEINGLIGPREPVSGAGNALSAAKMFVQKACVDTGILTTGAPL